MSAAARNIRLSRGQLYLIAGAIAALLGSLFLPSGAFTIDEALYVDMADAMASRGAFDITPQNLPEGSPLPLKSHNLVLAIDGRAVPQYPGLYGVIAAPFFAALGLKGLFLLNALAALASLWLTYKIATGLGMDEWTARTSVLLLGTASIFAGYVFAIWPHALSLFFVLAGAFYISRITAAEQQGAWKYALIAGLFFGIGVGIRVDVILSAIASFFWLRIFAQPSNRLAALALLAGLLPGLLLTAGINAEKFGSFNPFSYGKSGGGAALSSYLPVMGGVLAVTLFLFFADISKKPWATLISFLDRRAMIRTGIVIILLAGVWFVMPSLIQGLYVLLIDIQAFDGSPRIGQTRDEYGYWDFWGLPKKSLMQSMPFLVLIVLPFVSLIKGHQIRARSFLVLLAAAPICFFALRSWHGGMTFNLRYYLPAVPFLLILAADGLSRLRAVYHAHPNLLLRSLIAGIAVAVATYIAAPGYGPTLERPLQLYAPLFLALILLISVGSFLFNLYKEKSLLVSACLTGVTIGYAGIISVSDTLGYTQLRLRNASFDNAYAGVIPDDALIFARNEEWLTRIAIAGTAIYHVPETEKTTALQALQAYDRAGRCVYAQTQTAILFLGAENFIPLPVPENAEPGNQLYLYANSPQTCRQKKT